MNQSFPCHGSDCSAAMPRRQFLRMSSLVAGSALLSLPAPAYADENEIVLNLSPTPQHPRNSEGAFLTLKSGRIIFLYTRFIGGAADESAACIASIHSDDGGHTWSSDPKTVVTNKDVTNVMSVSLLRLHSGSIALFYLVKRNLIDCQAVMQISTDETETWSKPRLVTQAPGYFVLNNDRVIQLQTGRLVVPLAYHRTRGTDANSYRSWDSRGIVLWMLSDDDGTTWHEAEDWWALPARSHTGFQEPGVVELEDGRIFSWMRTDQGVQYGCWSTDSGSHWPLPEKTGLLSPESPASIKRMPNSAALIAVFNDHSGQFPFPKGKRSPLVAAISTDGGRSWPRRKLIESDPDGWYCYTAIHHINDGMLLAYCAGDSKIGGLNRLRIRRICLPWLSKD